VLRDQNRSGHRDVLRIRIGCLKLQALGETLVQGGLEGIVFLPAPRQESRYTGGEIGDPGQRLAGGAAAELSVIQVYGRLDMSRVHPNITNRPKQVAGEVSLDCEVVCLVIS